MKLVLDECRFETGFNRSEMRRHDSESALD